MFAMLRFFWHSLVLSAAFVFVFVWQQTILSQYIVQIIGFFVLLYLSISAKNKYTGNKIVFGGASDIFILTVVVLLIVMATNGLSGGMFFLLYFLGFGIAFVFEPWCIFVFVVGSIAVFLPQALNSGDVLSNFVKLGTLLLISPLAFFFGLQYKKSEEQEAKEEETRKKAQTIEKEANEVLQNEKKLSKTGSQKLKAIVEESESLQK